MESKKEVACLLQYMRENPAPLGSGKASELLQAAGFQVSEATVGRLLRYTDQKGYTTRQGFKGRVLTGLGRETIKDFLQTADRLKYSEELAKIVRSHSLESLLETLAARRAIEREIARLAALNIRPAQVEALGLLAREYQSARGEKVAEIDVAFHQALAEAAGNRVLRASLDLIRQDAQLAPILSYIRAQLHRQMFLEHKKIYDGVAANDPAAAEQAMITHIESIISDVKKYWDLVNGAE